MHSSNLICTVQSFDLQACGLCLMNWSFITLWFRCQVWRMHFVIFVTVLPDHILLLRQISLMMFMKIFILPPTTFLANVLISYLVKTSENQRYWSENQRYSDVFRKYEMGKLSRNGLSYLTPSPSPSILNPQIYRFTFLIQKSYIQLHNHCTYWNYDNLFSSNDHCFRKICYSRWSLTHFSPVLHFYTPWRFQGVLKCDTGIKWVKRGTFFHISFFEYPMEKRIQV